MSCTSSADTFPRRNAPLALRSHPGEGNESMRLFKMAQARTPTQSLSHTAAWPTVGFFLIFFSSVTYELSPPWVSEGVVSVCRRCRVRPPDHVSCLWLGSGFRGGFFHPQSRGCGGHQEGTVFFLCAALSVGRKVMSLRRPLSCCPCKRPVIEDVFIEDVCGHRGCLRSHLTKAACLIREDLNTTDTYTHTTHTRNTHTHSTSTKMVARTLRSSPRSRTRRVWKTLTKSWK